MVAAIAWLPVAPALVPAISRGAFTDVAPIAEAIDAALDRVLGAGPVLVLGPEDTDGGWGSAQGFGVDLTWRLNDSPQRLPWAQAFGAWLLAERGLSGAAAGPSAVLPDDAVVLAMGDGSICRTDKAPGALDPRAQQWDESVAQGLAGGSLAGIDWALGTELQAAGVPLWHALGTLEGPWDAQLHAHEAPQGVGLIVATWTRP